MVGGGINRSFCMHGGFVSDGCRWVSRTHPCDCHDCFFTEFGIATKDSHFTGKPVISASVFRHLQSVPVVVADSPPVAQGKKSQHRNVFSAIQKACGSPRPGRSGTKHAKTPRSYSSMTGHGLMADAQREGPTAELSPVGIEVSLDLLRLIFPLRAVRGRVC